LAKHLDDWGMATTTAASEASALAQLRTAATSGRPVAVALVDSDIPEVDGLHLAATIRANPGLDAQVVLMTDQTEPRAIGGHADVSATVANPIDPTNLRTCLQEVLARTEGEDTSVEMVQFPARQQPALGRLLLAEDNLVNQKVAVAMLSTGGYHVDAVLNGAAAVKAAARQPYDAILMDCQMPELDGYAATIAIRASENGGRRIPIIAMTASARDGNQQRCLASGMDHFLAKPVDRIGLLSVVAASLAS
jgi:hypothetical protein